MSVKVSKPQGHSGSHEDRCGKHGGWGDNGAARPTTKEYSDGFDKIDFSKNKPKERKFRMKVNGKYVD